MPAEKLSELFDALIRQSFIDCKIDRGDGEVEAFDPVTLFSSLIESEIDLVNATKIFDTVIRKIETDYAARPHLTHQEIHDNVSRTILEYPHPHASFWLSNYEGMFSIELDREDGSTDFIDARNARSLRNEIRFFIDGKRDIIHADSSIIRDITNRIIKLIRFCGFYKVRRSFLQLFLEELSISSTKAYVPNAAISDDALIDRLDQIERMLLIIPDLAPEQHLNFCSAISSMLTTAILGWLGVIHSASNGKSIRHIKAILDDFYRRKIVNGRSQPNAKRDESEIESLLALRRRLDSLFAEARLDPELILNDIDAAIEAQDRQHTSEFIFFVERTIRYFRIVASESDLLRGIISYRFGDDSSKYLAAIGQRLSQDGLEILSIGTSHIDIRLNTRFHKIVEFGDTLRLIIAPGLLDEFEFDIIEQQAAEARSTIFALLIESNLGGPFLDNLRAAVGNSRRLISAVRRSQFERALVRGEDIRTLVHAEFFKLYPQASEWQGSAIFEFDEPQLPEGLRQRELEMFKSILGAIEKGPETTPTLQALHILESRIREHALLVHALASKLGSTDGGSAPELSRIKPFGFADSVGYLRRFGRATPRAHAKVAALLPRHKLLADIEQLRKFRNVVMHNDLVIDPIKAKDAVYQVANVISQLSAIGSAYNKLASDSVSQTSVVLESTTGEMKSSAQSYWSNVNQETKRRVPVRWRFGYVDHDDTAFAFLAFARCTECEGITRVMQATLAQRLACEACEENSLAEGDWAQFISKLKATDDASQVSRDIAATPDSKVKGSVTRPAIGESAMTSTVTDVRVAVIVALAEEYKAFKAHFGGRVTEKLHLNDNIVEVLERDGSERIGLLCVNRMGNIAAAVATTRLLDVFNLDCVVNLGLAAGVDAKKQALGDIVIANRIRYYETGKLRSDRFDVAPEYFDLRSAVLHNLETADYAKWPLGIAANGLQRQVHIGTLASGEKVVSDRNFVEHLLSHDRKTVGIEMESYGISSAVFGKREKLILIRGISDFADQHKNDAARLTAMEGVVRFFDESLQRGVFRDGHDRPPIAKERQRYIANISKKELRDGIENTYLEVTRNSLIDQFKTRKAVIHKIADRFSMADIRRFCIQLKIDWDEIPGNGKADKAASILDHVERKKLLSIDELDRLVDDE